MAYSTIAHSMNSLFPSLLSIPYEYNIEIDEIDDTHPKAKQPGGTKITLKPHQLSLLYRCIDYENSPQKLHKYKLINDVVTDEDYFRTNIGIIADKVGSGKSYVILSLIVSNNITTRESNFVASSGLNNVTWVFRQRKPVVKTSLIVIPHNLCSQWVTYIKTYDAGITYKVISKTKHLDDFMTQVDSVEQFNNIDVLVITATYFNRIAKYIADKDIRVQRVFFDEVDNLNISGCISIESNFIWFVTASYGNLLYPRGFTKYDNQIQQYIWCANGVRKTGFLKNVFLDLHTNMPKEFVKVLILKNDEKYLESSLCLPEMRRHVIKCKTPINISILHGIVDTKIIDSLNAYDIAAAISCISPHNKGSEGNIIVLLIERLNKQLTNLKIRYNMISEFVYDDEQDRENDKKNLSSKIEEVENKIKLITERITTSDSCSICFDQIENKTITKCCQNSFCFSCIMLWLSQKAMCPMCKSKMTSNDLFVVAQVTEVVEKKEEKISEDDVNEKFEKLKNLDILLKLKKPFKPKILLFSSYENTFTTIAPILNAHGYKYDFIKGNGDQIKHIIRRYKEDILDVLLINTNNYGMGLNLENTTDIIMFHKFDTQLENQVIGRAHRLGRTIPLDVHYLLHENEIK